MRTSHLAVGSSNPTQTILGYRRQIVYHIHFWTLMVVAPLFLVQLRQGHRLLSVFLAIFCLNTLAVIMYLRWRNLYLFQGRTFALFACICTIYSTYQNGYVGLFWAYPSITALFFLLKLREAIGLNLAFLFSMVVASSMRFPEPEFWRITFSLALTSIFVMTFAWLVGRMQAELSHIASVDPLTGCLNRSRLDETLAAQIQIHQRYQRPSSLVALDLDHFKQVNDHWGHQVGDRLLQSCAQRLQERLRETDRLYRVGGEEFLVLLPETDISQAEAVADDLLRAIRQARFIDGIGVTASAGVATLASGVSAHQWMVRADSALYAAKNAGRDQVICATDDSSVSTPVAAG